MLKKFVKAYETKDQKISDEISLDDDFSAYPDKILDDKCSSKIKKKKKKNIVRKKARKDLNTILNLEFDVAQINNNIFKKEIQKNQV